MSSFGGTNTANGAASDPGLQLHGPADARPDFGTLKDGFDRTVADLESYRQQCQVNYMTRYALWSGQSADGKKHAREGSKVDPTPWDGASDLQVFLTDEAINSKVAMLCTAFRKSNIVATPVEGNDLKRAKTVSTFMKWLIHTQVPEVDREVELLANILEEKGIAATGQFWEVTQEKTLMSVNLNQFQQMFPTLNVMEMIYSEEVADDLMAIFEEIYGCTKKKARKMLMELRETGQTTVATAGREKSRPVIRAFNLDEQLFIPPQSTDLETAAAIYRVEYFTAEQLRSFVNTAGWDEAWVESAIEKLRGSMITMTASQYFQPIARSFVYQEQKTTDLIGVVYAYRRLSDEDGVPGIYCTIFSPLMGPDQNQHGYAKDGLLGFAHGKQPFVLFRREFLTRKLHDSRGIPEPGRPFQDQIKVHKDSRIDAASIAICPPLMYPVGRPPGRWGAGARVPERRPGEYRIADRPAYDPSTEKSEQLLADAFNRYNGFVSRETDPMFSGLKNQNETDKWLTCWSKVFQQVWSLWKQFGPPEVYFRVTGLKEPDATQFVRGDNDEEFDFMLSFQISSLDPEQTFTKLEQIAKIVATADRNGIVNYDEWLLVMIEAIDPTIAERIIRPVEEGREKVVSDMQDTLAKVYAGQDQNIKLGTPPELGLQVIQNYVQGDPVVQARMQNKEDPFGARIEKLAKQFQFQITQSQNAVIGRLGA